MDGDGAVAILESDRTAIVKNALSPWTLSQVAFGGLCLFLFHTLITKEYRGAPLALAAWLAVAFVLVLVLRATARRQPADSRSWWQDIWAALDGVGLVFVAFFLILLLVLDTQYLRATSDGREYFVHVRSLVMDFDLDFANENEIFRTRGTPHIFPFGSAVLWLPFYVAAHLWLGLLNLLGGSFVRDGFNNTYQMANGLGTLIYGFAGLLMIYRIGREYFAPRIMAAATIFLTAGGFLVWYLAVENSFSQGCSLFATMLFLLVWVRTRDARSVRQWAWLGLAAGLMSMVRWQNAAFLLFPMADAALALWRMARGGSPLEGDTGGTPGPMPAVVLMRSLAAFGGGLILGFLPQMVFWKVVNGGWLALPHGQYGQQWWADSLMVDVLFSSNHGLVAWHPIIYFAVLGIPLFVIRDIRLGGLLTTVFLIQIYAIGAVAMWWGGPSFGGRRFESCTLLFALGLAAFIGFCKKRPLVVLFGGLSMLVLVNAFFIADVRRERQGMLLGTGHTFNEILGSTYRRIGNPFSFPANVLFGFRYGITPLQYDQLGLQMYNNLRIDIGEGSADGRFLGAGWSGREQNGDISFRWALGPESVVIAPLKSPHFLLPGEPQQQPGYLLRFRAQPYHEGEQTIEFWVNGELVGHQPLAPQTAEYEITIPAGIIRRNLNAIVMRYSYWLIDPGTVAAERRPLAVRFEQLDFIRQGR